jgi:hypothetical protein
LSDPEGAAMPEMTFPALFHSADAAAARFQRLYLQLIGGEYLLLIGASAFLLAPEDKLFHAVYAVIFALAIAILSYRTFRKPQQAWSECRAVAEQVKSYTWRYAVRAEPFHGQRKATEAHAAFRDYLKSVLAEQRDIAGHMAGSPSGGEAITPEMDQIRAMTLEARRDYYGENRLRDQKDWYGRKAAANMRVAGRWVAACIFVYILGFVLALLKIAYEWEGVAIEPIIIIASSILGWMQAKKYNELASTYAIAALQTGLILEQVAEADSEDEFAKLADDAETAFAQENHQWVAKQVGGH